MRPRCFTLTTAASSRLESWLGSAAALPDTLRRRNDTIETIEQRHRNAVLGRLPQRVTQRLMNFERTSRIHVLERRHTMLRCARFEHAACLYDNLHCTFLSPATKARGRKVRLIRQLDSE